MVDVAAASELGPRNRTTDVVQLAREPARGAVDHPLMALREDPVAEVSRLRRGATIVNRHTTGLPPVGRCVGMFVIPPTPRLPVRWRACEAADRQGFASIGCSRRD